MALTTAVITETNADAPTRTIAEEIDAAYAERNVTIEQIRTEVELAYREQIDWLMIERDLLVFTAYLETIGFDVREFFLGTTSTTPRVIRPHRRANPRARSMRHEGCKYVIRKDHGTTAHRKQMEAIKAEIEKGKQSRRTQRRKMRKNQAGSGNPRRYSSSR